MLDNFRKYWNTYTEAAPLAVFRILFGLMMCISIIRFWSYGWIEKLYLEPNFHFSYFGFEWIKPLGTATYAIFLVCGLAALAVALGYKYRWAMLLFFLSFTYIELMDKTTYLNHYYFISILSFLMLFLPASAYFSIDAKRNPKKAYQYIPKWSVDSIKLLLGIVYFYAGLAKLNSDWMVKAMPLKIWLPSKFDIPFLGNFMGEEWVHYAFSWGGALYDLAIPFLLLYSKTRKFAFVLVVIFHVLTRVLFPIGMFPYIMIVSALIFFSPTIHKKALEKVSQWLKIPFELFNNERKWGQSNRTAKPYIPWVLAIFFAIQLLFPWRYLCYPGELFWTEEGYRFSWRVMLMEKSGYAQFKIVDTESGRWFYVNNNDFLTPFQEKQMAFQPDFIVAYAHFLKEHFQKDGHQNIAIYVESYVALNGRLSQPFVNPKIDLTTVRDTFEHKSWILPFNDDIKGI
ncbi:MAG: HTTM domain-containing protein [Bacteroidota bacterium]